MIAAGSKLEYKELADLEESFEGSVTSDPEGRLEYAKVANPNPVSFQ